MNSRITFLGNFSQLTFSNIASNTKIKPASKNGNKLFYCQMPYDVENRKKFFFKLKFNGVFNIDTVVLHKFIPNFYYVILSSSFDDESIKKVNKNIFDDELNEMNSYVWREIMEDFNWVPRCLFY